MRAHSDAMVRQDRRALVEDRVIPRRVVRGEHLARLVSTRLLLYLLPRAGLLEALNELTGLGVDQFNLVVKLAYLGLNGAHLII